MPEPTVVMSGDLAVYLDQELVTLHDRPLAIKGDEYRLLAHLARHKGETWRKMDLLDAVYGPNATNLSTMDNLLARVRKKLFPLDPQFYIKTVAGKGGNKSGPRSGGVMLCDPY